ncbi:hypothetical protein ACFRJ1_09160 [Streptomyces sp. NPDC056773]
MTDSTAQELRSADACRGLRFEGALMTTPYRIADRAAALRQSMCDHPY